MELIQKFDDKIVSMVTTPRGDIFVATEYEVYLMRDGDRSFNRVLGHEGKE